MSEDITRNIIRFILIVLVQIILFNEAFVHTVLGRYVFISFYLIFIILLPIRTPSVVLLIIAFFLGMIIDLFSGTPGIHAAATVFIAFLRPYILKIIEPRQKYEVLAVPNSNEFGLPWLVTYISIIVIIHSLFFFAVEAFSFVFIGEIIIKTVLSSILTFLFIFLYQLIFNPNSKIH